jgi:hypothetical protein
MGVDENRNKKPGFSPNNSLAKANILIIILNPRPEASLTGTGMGMAIEIAVLN